VNFEIPKSIPPANDPLAGEFDALEENKPIAIIESKRPTPNHAVQQAIFPAFQQNSVNVDLETQFATLKSERDNLATLQEQLRLEFEQKLLKLQEKKNDLTLSMREIERKLEEERLAAAERARLEAQLHAQKLEAETLDQLSKELELICQNFPAYFQAHMYQHDDILFTVNAFNEGRNGILNANDLGLGKTFETIVTLYILSKTYQDQNSGKKPKVLWLTKKSLVGSTPAEIKTWWPDCKVMTPLKSTVSESDRNFLLDMYEGIGVDILLVNYEFVRTTPKVNETAWDYIVIDEVHKLKGGANSSGPTKIWEACKNLCHNARFNLFLSGTPMVNKPEEMWSYLHIFDPDKFPNFRLFERQFTSYRSVAGQFQLVVDSEKILKSALKGQMIRRNRKEVGLELPELTIIQRMLDMNSEQAKVYEQMRFQFFIWLDKQGQIPLTAAAIIAQLTRLRQINSWPAGIKITDPVTEHEVRLDIQDSSKIDETMDIIYAADDQVVVFCTFNEPMHEVKRRCDANGKKCEVIFGDTKNAGDFEKKFQAGEIDVLCVNLAMCEGLNLQKNPERWVGGSATGVLIDKWWSPARNEQAIGRIWRQGQTEPVIVYDLKNNDSIDLFMQAKLDEKSEAFESIMESKEIRPASEWRNFLEGVI